MRPPFEVTPRSARLLSEIERRVRRHEGALRAPVSPMLRRSLRVRTIQASLQIEGNTLTEEQVTAVLEGRRVLAPARDLREVRNAIVCYDKLPKWDPGSAKHLLAAHGVMMAGLVKQPGAWRAAGVGIAKGKQITHIAPPASRVPGLMDTHPQRLPRPLPRSLPRHRQPRLAGGRIQSPSPARRRQSDSEVSVRLMDQLTAEPSLQSL